MDWSKLGLDGTPRSLRDVWNRRDLAADNATFSVAEHDLLLLIVDGKDKEPVEYFAQGPNISGIQATRAPTFARLQYANTSGHVSVVRVTSTSGLSTALALPLTAGEPGTVGLILPKGTADLSFDAQQIAIRKLAVSL